MSIVLFEADVVTNVRRVRRFQNERFIHKAVRSYLNAVEIQTRRQNTTNAGLHKINTDTRQKQAQLVQVQALSYNCSLS